MQMAANRMLCKRYTLVKQPPEWAATVSFLPSFQLMFLSVLFPSFPLSFHDLSALTRNSIRPHIGRLCSQTSLSPSFRYLPRSGGITWRRVQTKTPFDTVSTRDLLISSQRSSHLINQEGPRATVFGGQYDSIACPRLY